MFTGTTLETVLLGPFLLLVFNILEVLGDTVRKYKVRRSLKARRMLTICKCNDYIEGNPKNIKWGKILLITTFSKVFGSKII